LASKGSKISAMIDECEFFTPPTEEQKLVAARLVCAFAQGNTREEQIADARDLVFMLGLHASQIDEDYIVAPAPALNRDCI